MNIKKILCVAVLVLCAGSALAQQEAVPTQPVPPAASEPMWSVVLNVVLGLAVVVQTFLLSRQVPADKVTELVNALAPLVQRTPTTLDDKLLELLRELLPAVRSETADATPNDTPTESL